MSARTSSRSVEGNAALFQRQAEKMAKKSVLYTERL